MWTACKDGLQMVIPVPADVTAGEPSPPAFAFLVATLTETAIRCISEAGFEAKFISAT
jgi:hypothetical protein